MVESHQRHRPPKAFRPCDRRRSTPTWTAPVPLEGREASTPTRPNSYLLWRRQAQQPSSPALPCRLPRRSQSQSSRGQCHLHACVPLSCCTLASAARQLHSSQGHRFRSRRQSQRQSLRFTVRRPSFRHRPHKFLTSPLRFHASRQRRLHPDRLRLAGMQCLKILSSTICIASSSW